MFFRHLFASQTAPSSLTTRRSNRLQSRKSFLSGVQRSLRLESLESRRVLAAVTIVETGTTDVEEAGATDIYTIALDTVPTGNVEIMLTADGQSEVSLDGVNYANTVAATFSDLTPQLVNVRAFDDADVEGAHSSTIGHAVTTTADAVNYPLTTAINNVVANITDNDETTVGLDGGNDLVIDDPSSHDDLLSIVLNGANVRVNDPSGPIVAGTGATQVDPNTVDIPLASITGANGIIVNGNGGSDELTIDLSGGDFTVAITFNGGADSDVLGLMGGGPFANVTHQFQSASDGSIDITGNQTFTYTGLEPVLDNLAAMNRVFSFTGGAETITLSDDTVVSDGQSLIDSTLGESVNFTNPTVSLTVNAGTGADTVNLNSLDALFAATLAVNGDADADTINVLAITGATTTTLAGGAADDIFDIGVTLTGSVDGEAGNDTLQGIVIDAVVVTGSDADGFAGTEPDMTLGFDGIDTITGNGGTFTGQDVNSTWLLDGTPTYNDGANTLNIGGFATLQGGNMVDQFNVTAATAFNLLGGLGNDAFDVDAVLTGALDGEAGTDTLEGGEVEAVVLTGSDADGFAGTEPSITLGFDGVTTITGTGGTLTGVDANSTWLLDGTPTYNDGANTLDFSGFATLQGGSMADQFDLTAASTFNLMGGAGNDAFDVDTTLTGSLDGEAGSDSLEGDLIDTVVLTGSDADGFAGTEADITLGFDGITTLTGAGGGTLTGVNSNSTWLLDGTPTYNDGANTLNFSGFAALQGGTMADQFNLTAASTLNLMGGAGNDAFDVDTTLTGSLDGEAGSDSLEGALIDTVVLTGSDADGFTGTEADITLGFDGITTITGTGAGMLTGPNAAGVWLLDGTPTYDTGVNTLNFSGFPILQGGDMTDQFNVTAASTFNLMGGVGNDAFDIDATLTGSLDGETGIDSLEGDVIDAVVLTGSDAEGFAGTEADITLGFDGINSITGNGGTLTGQDVNSTWQLDGTPTYNNGTDTLGIGGFANLQGGSMADQFNVTAASTFNLLGGAGVDGFDIDAALTGSLDGETGSDSLEGSVVDAVVLTGSDADGFAGTESNISLGFDGIATITGNGGSLTGQNVNSTWLLDGTPTYSDGANTLNLTGFAALQGGSMVDQFNVTAASIFNLMGGAGNDAFDVDATLTGSLDGEAGIDSLLGDVIDAVVVTGSDADGFAGTEADITLGFDGITTVTGNGGALTGADVNSTWLLDGTPTYNDGANTLNIGGFATLQGGNMVDQFNVTAATAFNLLGGLGNDAFDVDAVLTGALDGEAGTDTLEGGEVEAVVLTGSDADGFAGTEPSITLGFDGVTTITGTGGTLTGVDANSTWLLDGTPTYNDGANTLDFSGFATLQGGSMADQFDLTAASTFNLMGGAGNDAFDVDTTLTGSLDGEAGSDSLEGDLIDTVVLTGSDADGFAGTEADITLGFDGITTLTGAGGGTLTGVNSNSTWLLDGTPTYNDGANTLNFSGFAALQGGTMADQFNLTAASTLNLMGGAGNDAFDVDTTLTGSLDGEAGSDSLEGALIDTVVLTGSDADGFTGTEADITLGFDGITTITGTGAGMLTGPNAAGVWLLDGTPTYDTGVNTLNFSGFPILQGGDMTDQFNVTAASTFNLMGGVGNDAFDIDATLTGSLDGETGIDSLEGDVIDAVVLTGSDAEGFAGTEADITLGFDGINSITGNGGTLTGQDVNSTWQLDGTPTYNNGTDTLGIGGFANLQGGSMADQFNVTAASTFNLLGGAGVDGFDIDAALTGSLDGETGSDSLEGSVVDAVVLTGSDADGFAGTESNISLGFDGIATITGNGGSLTGQNVNSTWLLDGTPTYSDGANTLNLTGFAALQGGSMVDQFNVTAASIFNLMGGAGNDAFDVDATLTGSLDGEAGIDSLLGDVIDAVVVTGSDADGFAGTEADITLGFDGITTVTGNGGALTGADVNSTWLLDGTPTYNDGANTLNLGGFLTLRGGSASDQFNVTAVSPFALFGGAGSDTFTFATTGSLTGALDGESGDDTLVGDDDGNLFTVTGTNQGLLTGKTTGFSGIDNLTGGAANDSFDLGINLLDTILGTMTIAGGGHAALPTVMEAVTANGQTVMVNLVVGDTLQINDQNNNTAAQYNLSDTSFNRDGTTATVTFTGIETIDLNAGSASNDVNVTNTPASSHTTVTSQAAADDIDISTIGAGSAVVVTAGGGIDAVDVVTTGAGSVTQVNGGGAADSLTLIDSGAGSGVALNGEGGNDLITVQDSGSASATLLTGGAQNDQFNLVGLDAAGFVEVQGGAGVDAMQLDFAANDPVPTSGLLFDGGADADTLGVRGDGTTTIVHRPDAATSGTGTVDIGALQVTFTTVERSELSNALTATIETQGANDLLALTNGVDVAPTGINPLIEVSGTSGGTSIGTVAFFNNATMTVDMSTVADGTDQLTITSADNAHLNTNLNLQLGGNSDTVTFDGRAQVAGTLTIISVDADINDNSDADEDISAATLSATGATFGDAGANNDLNVAVDNLNVDTSASNGDQFISELDGIASLDLSAGAGNVTLSTGAAVNDADATTDVAATNLTATVVGGIGGAAGLDTEITSLAVASTGGACIDVHIQNNGTTSGPLTVTNATSTGGCDVIIVNQGNTAAAEGIVVDGTVMATGSGADVMVVSASPLLVNNNSTIMADETVTLIAGEEAIAGDDLTINTGATISTLNGDISLGAGDNITLQSGSSVLADTVADAVTPGRLFILGDTGNDSGTAIGILGTGLIGATGGTVIGGNGMDDSLMIQAERLRAGDDFSLTLFAGSDTVTLVFGQNEVLSANSLVINADDGVDDGVADQLVLDTTADTNARVFSVQYDNGDGTGRFSQLRAGTIASTGTTIDVNRADLYRFTASAAIPATDTNVLSVRGADNVVNQVHVGAVASGQMFEVGNVNCIHVLGKQLADTINLEQAPATADSLIIGGEGADDITGTPGNDLIFGGGGADTLRGGDGDDSLFADHTLAANGAAVVSAIVGGDVLIGGNGTDNAVSFGSDTIAEVEGTIFASGATVDVIAWLRARFIFDGNGQLIIDQALAEACAQFLLNNGIHNDAFTAGGGSPEGESPSQNPNNALDVNADGAVSSGDVLAVINLLNTLGTVSLADGEAEAEGEGGGGNSFFYDVNGDNRFSPVDVLHIINHLNNPTASGEGEGPANSATPDAVDSSGLNGIWQPGQQDSSTESETVSASESNAETAGTPAVPVATAADSDGTALSDTTGDTDAADDVTLSDDLLADIAGQWWN